MQKSILWVLIAFMAVSCNQTVKQEADMQDPEKADKIISASVVELLESPADFQGKEVAVSGLVTHVCRHGGQKCFIVAEDGETQMRIEPGGDIDEFLVDMEGSTIAFRGTFKILNEELAAANVEDYDSQEQHAVEQSHSDAEKAEYYIEAVEFKEVTP